MTTGRAFDRLVNFTDAVVAVAITLLVLSVVDIRGTSDEETVWAVIADNAPKVLAFVFTFLVVAAMWSVHNRLFNGLRGFDSTIFRLNLLWLLGVVILPWPSAMLGEGFGVNMARWAGGEGLGGTGLLYWGTLAWISAMGQLIALHVERHPDLRDPQVPVSVTHPWRGGIFAIVFVLFGIASLFVPMAASWLPLLLIPLSIWLGRHRG